MPSLTPMERFVNLIGGEQNLPPNIPKQTPAPAENDKAPDNDNEFSKLPSVEQVITEDTLWERAKKHNASLPSSILQQSLSNGIHSQLTPLTAPSLHQPTALQLKFDERMGEAAPLGIAFSPFGAVIKFCYKFVRPELSQPLATAFFDANKIYNRSWDLYHIWSDHYPTAKPIIFVPEHQLQALIDEINQAFPTANISITEELREDGVVIDFDGLRNELRPKWLGRCDSREQHDHWVATLPAPLAVTASMAADRDLQAFQAYMEKAIEAAKTKNKAKKNRSQQTAVVRRQQATKQVLRAQRYLGLMPKNDAEDLMPDMAGLTISAIDPSKAPPFPFDLDAIFIAIDCEAYEKSPRTVTEVGVATLDTRDLRGEAPGAVGQEWHKHIRARHFRLIEHKHLVNKEFCAGCPENFDYGQSEFVGKEQMPSVLTSCFHHPFSKKQDDGSLVVSEGDGVEEKRNIILLGHDVGQDVNYCMTIGFHPLNRGNMLDVLDSSDMYRAYTQAVNPTSLGNVCYNFDLTAWHAHNAGNDAVHTIWAFLAIAVKDASERGSEEARKKSEETAVKRTEEAIEQAKERAREESEGWAVQDGEDGGVAVPPKEEDFEFKRAKGQRPAFGPPRPPSPSASNGLFTMGGAPLDV